MISKPSFNWSSFEQNQKKVETWSYGYLEEIIPDRSVSETANYSKAEVVMCSRNSGEGLGI